MRRHHLLLPLIIFITNYNALCQEVIASGGGNTDTTDISVCWTIGEGVIETTNNNSTTLNQGFQQSSLLVSELSGDAIDLLVYPNPVSDLLIIESAEGQFNDIYTELLDINGKLIFKKKLTGRKNQIDLNEIRSASYILRISVGEKKKTFQIVKL